MKTKNIAKTAKWDISEAFRKAGQYVFESQHALMQGDTEQSDAWMDRFQEAYEYIDQVEADRLCGLSRDLYMLSDQEVFDQSDLPISDLATLIRDAHDRKDGDTLLRLLRHASYIKKEDMALLRARAYNFVGYLPAAIEFGREAARLIPHDYAIQAVYIELLVRAGQVDVACKVATTAIDQFLITEPSFIIFAACLLYSSSRTAHLDAAGPTLQQIINYIEPRINIVPEHVVGRSMIIIGYSVLALAYRETGDHNNAHHYATELVTRYPHEPDVWCLRGRLRINKGQEEFQSESDNFTSDFEKALELKTRDPFPYVVIALAYFRAEKYRECFKVSKRLVELADTDKQKALGYEHMAMSSIHIGYRSSETKSYFDRAVTLDLNNTGLRNKYDDFLKGTYERPSVSSDKERLSRVWSLFPDPSPPIDYLIAQKAAESFSVNFKLPASGVLR